MIFPTKEQWKEFLECLPVTLTADVFITFQTDSFQQASGRSTAVNCGCVAGDSLVPYTNTSILRFLLMLGLWTPKPHSACHILEASPVLSELNVIYKHALLQKTHCVVPWRWQLWQLFMMKSAVLRPREVKLRLRSGLNLHKASPCLV